MFKNVLGYEIDFNSTKVHVSSKTVIKNHF